MAKMTTLRKFFVVMVGAFSVAALGLSGLGQEAASTSLAFSGYVRPGNPTDQQLQHLIEQKKPFPGRPIGATIYFGIYDRTKAGNVEGKGDVFGTGMMSFDDRFHTGKGCEALDRSAQSIYLYQIVNDRAMSADQAAGGMKTKTEPISSYTIKLPLNADVSSWGYFEKTGFVVGGPDAPPEGMAVSSFDAMDKFFKKDNRNFGAAKEYFQLSIPSFTVGSSTLNLTKTALYEKLVERKKKGLNLNDGDADFMADADGKVTGEPELVEFVNSVNGEAEFRVTFPKDSPIKQGQHSILIGFTSKARPVTNTKNPVTLVSPPLEKLVETAQGVVPGPLAFASLPTPTPTPKVVQGPAIQRSKRPLVVGYTLPGNRSDVVTSNGILPMAYRSVSGDDLQVIGGRIVFAVYERTGDAGDPWGTGMDNMADSFIQGYGFTANSSPVLDKMARFLYLYQIVNDRGIKQTPRPKSELNPIAAAKLEFDSDGKEVPHTTDIASWAIRLSVDPRDITSWGYFEDVAFDSWVKVKEVAGAEGKGGIRFAATDSAEGKKEGKITTAAFPMSSFAPNLDEFPNRRYFNGSPELALPAEVVTSFGLARSIINLDKTANYAHVEAVAKPVAFQIGQKDVVKQGAANTPDYVQLLYGASTEGMADILGPVVFRADFINRKVLPGEHSVVFGFTSNLPPQPEPIEIKDRRATRNALPAAVRSVADVRPAADGAGPGDGAAPGPGPGAGNGIVPAAGASGVGNAPGPVPAPAAPTGGLGGFGGAMGQPAVGGFGGGGMPGMAGGIPGFGGGGGGFSGGGGGIGGGLGGGVVGGGTGTNTGQNQGAQNNQTQGQTQSGGTSVTNTISFAATLSNQQQQQQQQQQFQIQLQNQRNINHNEHNHHHHHHPSVVPAPGSFLLALLGVPGLLWMWRRKTSAAAV